MGVCMGDGLSLGEQGLQIGSDLYRDKQNRDFQQGANELNYSMWQKQLEYDRPINQVNRLREAGLNPALMYGTGSGANLSAKAPTMEAPQSKFSINPGLAVSVQQARLLGEQTRSLKMENDRNDPGKGAPRGSSKNDNAITRGLRELWSEFKDSGPEFVKGLKSYYNEYKGPTFNKRDRPALKDDSSDWKKGPNPNW